MSETVHDALLSELARSQAENERLRAALQDIAVLYTADHGEWPDNYEICAGAMAVVAEKALTNDG